VTIENIVFVVDCCFVKIKNYDFINNCESLDIVPVSKQSAKQRAGRAGRVKRKIIIIC
jgi:ATP-dependent RNA helicase DDX35